MALNFNPWRIGGGLRRFWIFALTMALFIGMAQSALAAGPYTVVTPNNPDGWASANVNGGAAVAITTAQPRGDTPNNLGSLEFTSPSGSGKADYTKYWPTVTTRTLGTLSELKYEFRRDSSSTVGQHLVPAFRLFYQTANNETGYLIWEDVYNGGSTATPVPTDSWISKDIFTGFFWMRAFGPSRTIEKYDVTLADWKSGVVIPNAHVLGPDTKILGIEVGVGSGWNGTFTGYVDNVAASFGADSITANFEPNPAVVQCTTDCYVDDDAGNDANGGTSFADAKQHIQAGVNQVSIGGTVHVKDGVYDEAITVGKPLTLEGIQHGVLAKGRVGPEAIIRLTTNQTPIAINASNVAINGFTFDMSQERTPWAITALSQTSYSNLKVQYNLFTGNPGTGDPNQDAGGAYLQNTINTLIEGNFFDRLGSHAIFMAASSDGTIYRNNDSLRNALSNFSNQVGPHTNTLVENNRAVEDSLIIFASDTITIKNNSFTASAANSSRVYLGGGDTNATVDGNTFTDMRAQAVQVFDANFGYGPNSNVTITNNDIPTNVGNQTTGGPYSLIDLRGVGGTNKVAGNTVTLSGSLPGGATGVNAVTVRGSGTGSVSITNNAFDGGSIASTSTPPSSGVVIRSNTPTASGVGPTAYGPLPASATITVANNYLKNFSNGLAVYDFAANSYGGLPNGVSLTVNKNSITGNSANGVITGVSDPVLNAENNWWGSNTGPTAAGNPGGSGDSAIGNVDYDPWLCSGTDDQPGTTGFQTSSSSSPCVPPPPQCTTTCYADSVNGSDTNGGASPADAKKTIQAAVNQVSPAGSVIVAAGSYPESVTVNKDGLTIRGADKNSTIIQGTNCTGNGITLVGTRNGLTIKDLSVTGFLNGISLGIISDTQTNITIEDVNASSNCQHGIHVQAGVISNLAVNRVTASNNGDAAHTAARGIWVINGVKTNISITNGTFSGNKLVGIDMSDGTVTGLTVSGNTVENNGDAGISVLNAQGPAANLIDSNTVRNNGRFGIELKSSTGNGADSGAGSLVVSRNIVERTLAATDARDYAGIAVIRRGTAQPSGAVVANNEVRGYRRAASAPANQDGFGIVVEGLSNTVKNNILANNDIGIQVQGGCSGDQNAADMCFGRGNAAQGDAVVTKNSIAGNGIGLRTVRTPNDTPTLNAENNWWGSNTGPTAAGNPGGSGDSAIGNVDYDPWLCSGTDDQPGTTGFQTSSSSSPCVAPGGTLSVTKYNDLNRNGAKDAGEPGLSGWTITVKQGSTIITSGTTDGNGNATFASLIVGNYTVCETLQSGWQNTDPIDGSGCKSATVAANQTVSVLLGNAQQPQQGTLAVTKYNDLNRNGVKDAGEPGLSGWTITVKQGSATITSGTTGSNGTVTFNNLTAGGYTVCETLKSGWQNTDPINGSGCKDATVTANAITNVVLGNASTDGTGTLKVTKYNDINRNGKRDSGEPGLSGWTITVKQGSATAASGTTNANGEVTFTLLPASYKVCETQQANWQNTDPSDGSGCKTVSVKKGSTASVVLGNASAPINPAPAQPGKIYAVNDGGTADSQFFTINLSSPNSVTALGPLYKDYDLEGLDIDPTTGVIYATSGGDNKFNQKAWLYKVDGLTGALTAIGSTGQKEVESLAFAPDGTLWGWGIGKGLIKINLATGASTLVFKDSKDVEGLAFSNDGKLVYASSGKKLYVYTVATGKIAELASNLPGVTEALETRPDGKLLLGVDGSKVIYVYDPITKQVTAEKINVAPYSDVEGIGYSPS